MNTYDTNKLISAIQSFADRLRNDDRSSIMFEADWDTLMESKAMLRQQQDRIESLHGTYEINMDYINKLQAEIEALKDCLKTTHDETMSYIKLNSLGGENNHWLVWARELLKRASEK